MLDGWEYARLFGLVGIGCGREMRLDGAATMCAPPNSECTKTIINKTFSHERFPITFSTHPRCYFLAYCTLICEYSKRSADYASVVNTKLALGCVGFPDTSGGTPSTTP